MKCSRYAPTRNTLATLGYVVGLCEPHKSQVFCAFVCEGDATASLTILSAAEAEIQAAEGEHSVEQGEGKGGVAGVHAGAGSPGQ